MATMDEKRLDFSRKAVWLLKIYATRCQKFNPSISSGESDECLAVEPCYYSWATCKDTASFTPVDDVLMFSSLNCIIKGAKPLLDYDKTTKLPIAIQPDKFNTEIGEMRFVLLNDSVDGGKANPQKLDYSLDDNGTYWPNFARRDAFFKGWKVELWRGFDGVDINDFEMEFCGVIYDIDTMDMEGIKLICRSYMWKLAEKQIPNKIPTNVVTTDNPLAIGATFVTLDDGTGAYSPSNHFEAATVNQPRCVKINDELFLYTAIDDANHKLTGLTGGAFGTTPASHAQGSEVKQVLVYGNDDSATWAGCSGVIASWALLDMLIFYAGVPADKIAKSDTLYELTAGITSGDTTIPLDTVSDLPNSGFAFIGSEIIYWASLSSLNAINCKRGMFGTTAAAHSLGDSFEVVKASTANAWRGAEAVVKLWNEDSKSIKDLMILLRADTMLDVWPNESGEIDVDLQKPILGGGYPEITDADIVSGSKNVDLNKLAQISRVLVYYNPVSHDAKTSGDDAPSDYQAWDMYVNRELESQNAFNEPRIKTIFAPWLYTYADAHWLATHYYIKYSQSIPLIDAALEIQHGDKAISNLINLTVAEIVDDAGNALQILYKIIGKVRKSVSRYLYNFEGAGLGGDKYAVIGPPNGVLDANISDVATAFDLDLSGTGMSLDDFKSGGNQQVIIESEKITYTTVVLLSTSSAGDVLRFSGCTRGVDGTANVAHTAGVDVLMLASASSISHRASFGHIGSTGDPPTGNLLDYNGDLTNETAGFLAY